MIAQQQARPQWFQRLLYCDVESKWINYHITTFLDRLSPKTLSLEEAMDLSRDRNEMNDDSLSFCDYRSISVDDTQILQLKQRR
jgi:hypothetical protein